MAPKRNSLLSLLLLHRQLESLLSASCRLLLCSRQHSFEAEALLLQELMHFPPFLATRVPQLAKPCLHNVYQKSSFGKTKVKALPFFFVSIYKVFCKSRF